MFFCHEAGARHICGSGGYNRITDRTELTGPIQKVYKSGSLVTMWVFVSCFNKLKKNTLLFTFYFITVSFKTLFVNA